MFHAALVTLAAQLVEIALVEVLVMGENFTGVKEIVSMVLDAPCILKVEQLFLISKLKYLCYLERDCTSH